MIWLTEWMLEVHTSLVYIHTNLSTQKTSNVMFTVISNVHVSYFKHSARNIVVWPKQHVVQMKGSITTRMSSIKLQLKIIISYNFTRSLIIEIFRIINLNIFFERESRRWHSRLERSPRKRKIGYSNPRPGRPELLKHACMKNEVDFFSIFFVRSKMNLLRIIWQFFYIIKPLLYNDMNENIILLKSYFLDGLWLIITSNYHSWIRLVFS